MVIGSNLGRSKLSFLFAKINFGMNVKRQRNPSLERQPRGLEKQTIMKLEWKLPSQLK